MAVDKLVDSTQLDADLTSVANAIRTKGGTSAQLAFPAGFVQAIEDIEAGGGGEWTTDGIADGTEPNGAIETDVVRVAAYAFANKTGITSVSLPNVTYLMAGTFDGCNNVSSFSAPKLERAEVASFRLCGDGASSLYLPAFKTCGSNGVFRGLRFTKVVLPSITSFYSYAFEQGALIQKVDCGNSLNSIPQYNFNNATDFKILVLRKTSVVSLGTINAFANTPFASGKSGGTLYVPSALISSYQAATNWSTILGYTNNQIKSIESTATDPDAPVDLTTHYIDGTPIPTT